MKNTALTLVTSLVLFMPTYAVWAQSPPAAAQTAQATKAAGDMADGEVRKIDKENKKITLRHGVIKNLDMPAMTMVFQVKDAALLDKLKAGDKIRFSADKVDGAYTVLSAEPRP